MNHCETLRAETDRRDRERLAEVAHVPDWRDKLDVALDAMKQRRPDVSEPIYDELDDEHPGWHFAVPMRGSNRSVRIKNETGPGWHCHTFTPERRVKQIIAALLFHANRSAPRITGSALAAMFGVTWPTMRRWLEDGARDLKLYLGDLEEDFRTAEERRLTRKRVLDGPRPFDPEMP